MSDTMDEATAATETPPEMTIDVDPPIKLKGASYSVLNLREPKAFEIRQAEAFVKTGTMSELRNYQMNLLAKISGWPMDALEQLPIRTLNRAGIYVMGFWSFGPPNWRQLIAALTKYYGWPADSGWHLTGQEIAWYTEQGNEMVASSNEAAAAAARARRR